MDSVTSYEMKRFAKGVLEDMSAIYDPKNRRFRNAQLQREFRDWKRRGGARIYDKYFDNPTETEEVTK
jgi:hypothetical protein